MAILDCYGNSATTVIALRLLDHCNTKTLRCDPSYSTLAKGAGVDRRSAMRACEALARDGWLAIKRRHSDQKTNSLPNSFDFNWSKAGDAGVTTGGDVDVISLVTLEALGGDADVTTPSVSGVTQNCKTLNGEETKESKLIPSIEGEEDSDDLLARAQDRRHAEIIIGRESMRLLGYEPGSFPKLNGRYIDQLALDTLPPEALSDAVQRCIRGKLSRQHLRRAISVLGLPRGDQG